jgi:hypothetical protein
MTFDFTLYPPGRETPLGFTVDAVDETAARAEVLARLLMMGISPCQVAEWRFAVVIVRGRGR